MNVPRCCVVPGPAESDPTYALGTAPDAKCAPFSDLTKGYPPMPLRRFGGKICTSNIPNPPRIEVFPARNGSQAKPTRGSNSRREGLLHKGLPLNIVVPVRLCRLPTWPFA